MEKAETRSANLSSTRTTNQAFLTKHWLEASLDETDWRYRLLRGILQFSTDYFSSIAQMGRNFLIQLNQPVDEMQLEVFLDAMNRLTSTPVRLVPQETEGLYILLQHP